MWTVAVQACEYVVNCMLVFRLATCWGSFCLCCVGKHLHCYNCDHWEQSRTHSDIGNQMMGGGAWCRHIWLPDCILCRGPEWIMNWTGHGGDWSLRLTEKVMGPSVSKKSLVSLLYVCMMEMSDIREEHWGKLNSGHGHIFFHYVCEFPLWFIINFCLHQCSMWVHLSGSAFVWYICFKYITQMLFKRAWFYPFFPLWFVLTL